ncbi:Alpha/Beta hydrolase protein [Mycena belliarum]|uniref:Alpha/Beta hydrolase protein n=1 Tax=Mycena belliarum TaxID=1033014 RepID=A0AAD6UB97_9AGAR|nr:Alpha/Beta hydrolase protein [Mycena belliae]
MFSTAFVLFTALTAVFGAPAPVSRRAAAAVTTLSATDLSDLDSFTQFARAAYCPVDKLMAWKCGQACKANPKFEATLSGGMGNAIQFFFVGYYPKTNSVIVSHQGTDPLALMSVLTDLKLLKGALNSTLFPGTPKGVETHIGFRDQHAIKALEIQAEVKRLIKEKGATQVTTVGHSLGGALAELNALSLRLNLPAEIGVNAVTYGTPRVGNDDFVKFFDSKVDDFKRVNNEADLVPTVPGRFLGFSHPKGEIHIVDADKKEIVACPGNDDDTNEKCQIKTVPSILSGNILNHLGPYNGIFIGSIFCD